jgi:hypothetical protein
LSVMAVSIVDAFCIAVSTAVLQIKSSTFRAITREGSLDRAG